MVRLIVIFLLLTVNVSANNRIDSLKKVLRKQQGLEKIETYIQLHDETYIADPYRAIGFIKEAIQVAEFMGENGMAGSLHNRIGNIYFTLGLNSLALDSYFISLKYGEESEDKGSIAYCYNDIANVYFDLGNNKIPSEYYLNSIKLFKEVDNTLGLAVGYNNLGLVALRMKQYDRALDYFFQSFELRKKEGNVGLMAHSNRYISDVYLAKGQFQKAIEHLDKSFQLYGEIDEDHNQAKTLSLLGDAYCTKGDFEQGVKQYNRALQIFKKFEDYLYDADMNLKLGRASFELKKFKPALDYAQRTIALATVYELPELKRDGLKLMADIHYQKGNERQAIEYLYQYENIKDSIWEISNNENFTRLQFNIATYKEEREKEILKAQVRKKALQRNYLIVIFILGGGVLVVFFSRIRLKRQQEKLIFKQKEEISQLEMAKKEEENLRLNRELEFRNKELTSKTMSIVKSGEFIGEVVKELEGINAGKENKKMIDGVIDKLKHNLKEDSWKEFEIRFGKVHKDFYKKLNELYPDLTPNEKKLCAFLRLNMSTKEISSITYQSAKSIDVARSRLRKKLNLSREENLINFLFKF
ncbi:MAG: tetratricopeptide repeat protein [Marinifilaceae bacterium]